jgi:hypothetical protein
MSLVFLFFPVFADGIYVTADLKHVQGPHTVLKLNEKQRNEVERLRTLTLTKKQRDELRKIYQNIPQKMEVLSSRYKDCTCMMGIYAVWCRVGEVDVPHSAMILQKDLEEYSKKKGIAQSDEDLNGDGAVGFVSEFINIDSRGKLFLKGKMLDQSALEKLLLNMKKKPAAEKPQLDFDVPPPIDKATDERIQRLIDQTGKLCAREGINFYAMGLEPSDYFK